MARAGRICGVPRCPARAVRAGKCEAHLRAAESARGSSGQRGYGWDHQKRRRELLRAKTGQLCPVCDQPLRHDQPREAAHTTPRRVDPTSEADALVHAWCNPRGQDPRNYQVQGEPHGGPAGS